MAKDDAGGFQPKLLTQECGRVVAELVGVPMEWLVPRLQLGHLFFGQVFFTVFDRE